MIGLLYNYLFKWVKLYFNLGYELLFLCTLSRIIFLKLAMRMKGHCEYSFARDLCNKSFTRGEN